MQIFGNIWQKHEVPYPTYDAYVCIEASRNSALKIIISTSTYSDYVKFIVYNNEVRKVVKFVIVSR